MPDSDLPDSDLPDSDLPDSDLPDSDLPDSDLPDSDLPDSDLPDSDLPDSDLPDSDLPDSDLPGSDLPDSDLPDSDLPDSDLPDSDLPDSGLPDSDLPDCSSFEEDCSFVPLGWFEVEPLLPLFPAPSCFSRSRFSLNSLIASNRSPSCSGLLGAVLVSPASLEASPPSLLPCSWFGAPDCSELFSLEDFDGSPLDDLLSGLDDFSVED
ncbi:MAG: pentapeptide repeat-containing protein [Pirellula sp.]